MTVIFQGFPMKTLRKIPIHLSSNAMLLNRQKWHFKSVNNNSLLCFRAENLPEVEDKQHSCGHTETRHLFLSVFF